MQFKQSGSSTQAARMIRYYANATLLVLSPATNACIPIHTSHCTAPPHCSASLTHETPHSNIQMNVLARLHSRSSYHREIPINSFHNRRMFISLVQATPLCKPPTPPPPGLSVCVVLWGFTGGTPMSFATGLISLWLKPRVRMY